MYNDITSYDVATDYAGGALYGGYDSVGMLATNPENTTGVMTDGGWVGGATAVANRASGGQLQADPIQGMVIALVLLFIIGLITHHFGRDDNDFGNIRASLYNGGIISLVVLALVPMEKLAFGALAQTGLPGAKELFTYVNAA